nr:site-specific integrase [uncultured Cohaesibacter sp.]
MEKPLLRDDLFVLLDPLKDRPKDIRDRAILLIGFSAGMRRSEIVALNAEDIEAVDKGLLITIRRSKTDQEGQGRTVAIPFGRTRHCPVTALKDWLTFAGISQGPIFTAINKHGQISNLRISGEAVRQMLKVRLRDAGYDPTPFSGHSLRAGFATSARASNLKIRQVTGHKSDTTLNRYIRSTDLFTDAAAGRLL